MKKTKKWIALLLSVIMLGSLTANCFAYDSVFVHGPLNENYSRTKARDYLNSYTTSYNPNYANYTNYGGDCTNFISQMLRAGGMVMTPQVSSPDNSSWYYYGANIPNRSSTWTGANQFRSYWGAINGVGNKKARAMYVFTAAELHPYTSSSYNILVGACEIGDVIQYVNANGQTTHSMGVQRVYYNSEGKRAVTISQHTSNNFYSLTEKLSLWYSGWVVLLKMNTAKVAPASIGVPEETTSGSLTQFLEDTQFADTAEAIEANTYDLEDLSTAQLSAMVDALNDAPCETAEIDAEKWEEVRKITNILDARYAEKVKQQGGEIIPDTVVTKDTVIKLVEDHIALCEITISLPPVEEAYLEDGATMSYEECRQQYAELLSELKPFFEEIKANATDENAFDYWEEYWEIRGDPMPEGYCRG